MRNCKGLIRYRLFVAAFLSLLPLRELRPQDSCRQILEEADLKYRRQQYREAIALLKPCQQASEKEPVYKLLSKIYFAQGERDSAKTVLRRLRQWAPAWRPDRKTDARLFYSFAEEVLNEIEKEEQARKQQAETKLPPADTSSQRRAEISPAPRPIIKATYAPPRLFYLADARVLSSFEITWGLGTHLGFANENQRPPYLWHAGIGLGEVAELEFRSVEVLNKLESGKPELITGAFKLGLNEKRFFAAQPAVAGIIRLTISNWGREEHPPGKVEFQKKLDTYHLVFSKQLKSVRLHGGIGKNILRFRIRDAVTDEFIVAQDSAHYINRQGPLRFFGGLQWRANKFSMLMVDNWYLAKYNLNEAQPAQNSKADLEEQHLVSAGIRFFPSRGLAFDAAIIKRTGLTEVDDDGISFRLALNFGFSSVQFFQETQRQD